jgi:hypothetical protein
MNVVKNNLTIRLLILAIALAFTACDENDNQPKGKYEDGVLVINEGNFTQANGTVTHYNKSSQQAEQNILRNVNGFAGSVAQSLTIHGDRGYLVLNGGNKIEIVNPSTFESLGSISGTEFDKPRYVEIADNKAYVSMWGPYEEGGFSLVDSYVLVVDLSNQSVLKKIETDEGTENLLLTDDYLFASNNNFGGSRTIAIIRTADNTLVDQVEVGSGPAGLVEDINGDVWVICSGDYGGNNGLLIRIDGGSLEVTKTVELNLNPEGDLGITPDREKLIYSSGKNVYSYAIGDNSAPVSPLFTASEVVANYALGVDSQSGDVWIGDALDYTSTGKVYIYDATGSFKSSFDTGIAPGQFIFR